MHFLAQINLAEMHDVGLENTGLPEIGILYFFYDTVEQPWGFRPADKTGFKVLYIGEDKPLVRTPAPELPDGALYTRAAVIQPGRRFTPIPAEGIQFEHLHLSKAAADIYWDFLFEREEYFSRKDNANDNSKHMLKGWPHVIQNPMEEECALVSQGVYGGGPEYWQSEKAKAILKEKNEWVLLLQIDSAEETIGFMWCDLGHLYFWIKETDLQNRRFDNVWVILQCG